MVIAIPTYVTQTVWLPRKTTQLINRAARNFVWSSRSSDRGWHLVNWDTITKERKDGGLGVREAATANTAVLGKSIWSLLHNPNKLWVQVVSHKYLRSASIMSVGTDSTASSFWRGLLKARDQLKDGFTFKLGDGSTSLWFQEWCSRGILRKVTPFIDISESAYQLKDLVKGGSWDLSTVYKTTPDDFQAALMDIPSVLDSLLSDVWCWQP